MKSRRLLELLLWEVGNPIWSFIADCGRHLQAAEYLLESRCRIQNKSFASFYYLPPTATTARTPWPPPQTSDCRTLSTAKSKHVLLVCREPRQKSRKTRRECNFFRMNLERAMGIEPTSEAWEASILPLYDARSLSLIVLRNRFFV